MYRIGALFLLLAACAAPQRPEPPAPAQVYRNTAAPFASIASFEPARFAGRWYEIASYPVPFQNGCRDTQATYTPVPGGFAVMNTCLRNGAVARFDARAQVSGPGRFDVKLDDASFAAPYWVLWVDEGYRTAVVGTPSGEAAWILNRDPTIPSDRLTAAREILKFYGYDLSRLRMTPQGGV